MKKSWCEGDDWCGGAGAAELVNAPKVETRRRLENPLSLERNFREELSHVA